MNFIKKSLSKLGNLSANKIIDGTTYGAKTIAKGSIQTVGFVSGALISLSKDSIKNSSSIVDTIKDEASKGSKLADSLLNKPKPRGATPWANNQK
jgi:hypothetical protein|tara:strand:+ start:424 stop:708 length:285 start_codon:yes stop_codon:yes gene_type:complete